MRLRLTHPLGTQDFELDSRSADDPIIIGRANDADVKVPSVSVSRSHAAIFMHDGHWIVQDSGSRDGTFVNGQKIDGPVRLSLNDQVALGPGKAAVIEIVSLDAPAAATERGAAPVAGAVDSSDADADEDGDPDNESVAFDASAPPPVGYVPRRAKKNQTPMIIAASVAGVVIVASIGFAIWGYNRYQATQAAVAAANAKAATEAAAAVEVIPKPAPANKSKLFADAVPAQKPASSASVSPAPAAPVPVTPAPITPAPAAPANADPVTVAKPAQASAEKKPNPADEKWRNADDWQKVLEARDASPLPIAVLIYLDYKQQFKDSPLVKEADAFLADAMDQLWWQRVSQLIEDSKKMEAEIVELKKERGEADGKDRKAQIDRQIKDVQDRLASNKLIRDDMKVTLTAPPKIEDESAMEALRTSRDKAAFESWSQRVISRIKTSRGAAAW